MDKEIGNKTFPLWLIGDSNPKNWGSDLLGPLDSRHPARHNIWTSVLDVMQDRLFRKARIRLETREIYIRNAVEDPNEKPDENMVAWSAKLEQEIEMLRSDMAAYRPQIVVSFGRFAFEFSRRAFGETPYQSGHWHTKDLGQAFRQRLNAFDPHDKNLLPLLHVSISRGRFLSSHRDFCDQEAELNYFNHVGTAIADKLLAYQDQLDVWIQ